MIRLALNADTTPLQISDTLVFKSCEARADEAVAAGFDAVNVDASEAGLTPQKALHLLRERGLTAASGFFEAEFYNSDREVEILESARKSGEFAQQLGQTCLFVSPTITVPERVRRVGRILPAETCVLTAEQMQIMGDLLNRIAADWLSRNVALCLHPHVGSYVEALHEIEALLSCTDPALVRLGPDTGHLLFAGVEPVPFIEKHLDRTFAIHVKDLDCSVLTQVRARKMNYRQACAAGIWTELGAGSVDFPGLFDLLKRRDWSGWAIVESDHTRLPTALASSLQSRKYLREAIGL